jgi:hypothetical protein
MFVRIIFCPGFLVFMCFYLLFYLLFYVLRRFYPELHAEKILDRHDPLKKSSRVFVHLPVELDFGDANGKIQSNGIVHGLGEGVQPVE